MLEWLDLKTYKGVLKTKLFAGLLSLVCFALTANLATANQQIPAGYVLVPAEAFFGQGMNVTATQPVVTQEISVANSSLRAADDIGYVGDGYSTVTATLRDENGKAIVGSTVSLISSRSTDAVEALQASTDANGEAIFRVLASEEGVSSFTAVANNQTITERPRIVFLKKAGSVNAEFFAADVLTNAEPDTTIPTVSSTNQQINIEFPSKIVVNTPTDIKVTVTNLGGSAIEDFDGTISFQSTDMTAILPQDYTFTELDRGSHVFANAVTFTNPGKQMIKVVGDVTVSPEEIQVTIVGDASDLDAPIIVSPEDGALLNDSVTLTGTAAANSNLAVFVNGQFFTNGETDMSGSFFINLKLPDGKPEIAIAILNPDNSIGATSETITLTIDQTAPVLSSITLDPGNRVKTGSIVKAEVSSEAGLETVKLHIDDLEVELYESVITAGIYTGEFSAPRPGTYLVGVELTDPAGNVGEYPEATSLVTESDITIYNVQTEPQDSRVDLRWEQPENHAEVKNYEILYGTDPEQLTQKFTTTDNRTAWYIDELNNGTTYFFQIISLDVAGKQNGGSEVFSEIPRAIFNAEGCDSKVQLNWQRPDDPTVAGYRLDYGIAPQDYAESRMLSGGVARTEWEVRDLINGTEYFFTLRGVDDFGAVVARVDQEISATPEAGKVCRGSETITLLQRKDEDGNTVLFWSPVPGATSYRIYAGTQPNVFDLPTVDVEATSFQPQGLKPETDYFFAVSAIKFDSEDGELSNVAKVEVGPAETLLISLAVGVGVAWMFRKRRSHSLSFELKQ